MYSKSNYNCPSIFPNDNQRFSFQTNVPGFGFGSHIDSVFD